MGLMNQSNVSSQRAFDFVCARFVFFEAVGNLGLEIVGCSAGGEEVEDAEEEGGFGVEGWWHVVFFVVFFVLFCFVFVVLRCVAFLFRLLCLFCDGMIVSVVFFSSMLGWFSKCVCCLRLIIHVRLERVDHIRHDGIDFCCVHTSQFMLFLCFPMRTDKPVRSVLRCNGSTGAQLLYRLGEVCLQLVTLNTFTSHVGATEYQDCFIESTIYQLRHFLLLILLCRHASNRELF